MSAARRGIVLALLAALVLAVFWQVGGHQFLLRDDGLYVSGNPRVRGGVTVANVLWALTSLEGGNWHPLTRLSHQVDAELFGLEAGAHHLTSLFIHLAATLLLALVLRAMTGRLWPAALAAALFGIHPLHVESVAWVSERKDVLSGLCFVLVLASYLRYARRPGTGRYLAVALFLALGLAAKAMLVTAPFVLLLLDFWPLGRWSGAGGTTPAARLLREKLPLFALSAGAAVLALIAQAGSGAVVPLAVVPLPARLANAAVSTVRYLAMTVRPVDLAFFYPYPAGGHSAAKVVGSVLLLLAVTGAVVRLARRHPSLATGWLWYLIMLLPVIGLVQVGVQAMADRYTYLPLLGIFLAAAWGVPPLLPAALRRAFPGLAAAAVVILVPLAHRQVSLWRDNATLFAHALAVDPGNVQALTNLGLLGYRGDGGAAPDHPAEAGLTGKTDPVAFYNLGNYFLMGGEPARALPMYLRALELNPSLAEAYGNLGAALYELGDREAAVAAYSHALRQRPDYAEAMANLGAVLVELGRTEEGQAWERRAAGLDPRLAGREDLRPGSPAGR